MELDKDKIKVTSYKISKELDSLGFDAYSPFYYIKPVDKRVAKLEYMPEEFYFLPSTKVYRAYVLEDFLQIFGDYELQKYKLTVSNVTTLKRYSEDLADTAARVFIKLFKEGKIISEPNNENE